MTNHPFRPDLNCQVYAPHLLLRRLDYLLETVQTRKLGAWRNRDKELYRIAGHFGGSIISTNTGRVALLLPSRLNQQTA